MPFASIWPILTCVGILIGAIGVSVVDPGEGEGFWGPKITTALIGATIMFLCAYFWALEGNEGYHLHPDDGEKSEPGKTPAKH